MAQMTQVRIKNSAGGWDTKEVDPKTVYVDDYPADAEMTFIRENGDLVDVPIKDIAKVPKNIQPYYVPQKEVAAEKPVAVEAPKETPSFMSEVNSALSGGLSDLTGGLSTYPEAALDYLTSDAKSLQEAKQRGTAARDDFRSRDPYYAAELTSGAMQAAAMLGSGGLAGAGKLGTVANMATNLDTVAMKGGLAAVDKVGKVISPYLKPVADVAGKAGLAPVQAREGVKLAAEATAKIGAATAIANEAAKVQRANETGDLSYLKQDLDVFQPNLATAVHAAPAIRAAGMGASGLKTFLNPMSSTRAPEIQQALTPEGMSAIGELPKYKKYPLQNIVQDNVKFGDAVFKNTSNIPTYLKDIKGTAESDVAGYIDTKQKNMSEQITSVQDTSAKKAAELNNAAAKLSSDLGDFKGELTSREKRAKDIDNSIKELARITHNKNRKELADQYEEAKQGLSVARSEFANNRNREANALFGKAREGIGSRFYEIENTTPIAFRNEADARQKATAYANSWGQDLIKDLKDIGYNTSTATPLQYTKQGEVLKNPLSVQVAVNRVLETIRGEMKNRGLSVVSIQDAAKEVSDKLPTILNEAQDSALVSKVRTSLNRTASNTIKDISRFYPEELRNEIVDLAEKRTKLTELWHEAYTENKSTVKGVESDAQMIIDRLSGIDPSIAGSVLQRPKAYNEALKNTLELKKANKFYDTKVLPVTPEITQLTAAREKAGMGINYINSFMNDTQQNIRKNKVEGNLAKEQERSTIGDLKRNFRRDKYDAQSQQNSLSSKLDNFIYSKNMSSAESELINYLKNMKNPSGGTYPGITNILNDETKVKSLIEKLRLANIIEQAKEARNQMLPKESVLGYPLVRGEIGTDTYAAKNIFDDTGIKPSNTDKMDALQVVSQNSGAIQDSMANMDQIKSRVQADTGIGIGPFKYRPSPDLKYNAGVEYLQNYSIKRKNAMASIDAINQRAEAMQPLTRTNRAEPERERRKNTAKATLQLITSSAKDGVIPQTVWDNFVKRYGDMPTELYKKALEQANYIIEGF